MKETRIIEADPLNAGAQLKRLRIEKGIRPSQVAKATGLSYQRVNDIENKPGVSITLATAQLYCGAIGVGLAFVTDSEVE